MFWVLILFHNFPALNAISVIIQRVKRLEVGQGLTTPEGYNSNDRDIAVTYTSEPVIRKQPQLKDGLAALAKKGTIKVKA